MRHHPLKDALHGLRRFAREEREHRHHGRHGPHHGPHHGPGRRRERALDHGELRLIVLDLIAQSPRHGYDLIRAVEAASGGGYAPSPGVIYPTLTLLEEIGHAAVAESDGVRKIYAATEAGRGFLAEQAAAVAAAHARLAEMGAARASHDAPPILRAMENLKLALRLRTSRGALTAAQIDAIATALDAAARAVERS